MRDDSIDSVYAAGGLTRMNASRRFQFGLRGDTVEEPKRIASGAARGIPMLQLPKGDSALQKGRQTHPNTASLPLEMDHQSPSPTGPFELAKHRIRRRLTSISIIGRHIQSSAVLTWDIFVGRYIPGNLTRSE